MHIAQIASPHVPVPPKQYGGVERVIYYLIQGLMEEGHTVTLFASGDSDVPCELVPISEKHIFFGKSTEEQERVRERVNRVEEKTMDLLLERVEEFDVVHSHGFDLLPLRGVPHVTTLHGMFTLEEMDYFEKRKDLHYVSISNNQQKPLPDLDYIATVYNGLDPEAFPVEEQPQDYACFLGRMDREKNPHQAIELAIELEMPIKLAGKIDFLGADYFKEEVEPLLKHPLVEFIGEVGMEAKKDLLCNAAVNLHPTNFREPFGLTVIEAAYCGTPTIAVRRGSMEELIEDGRSGILVEDFIEAYTKVDEALELDRSYISQRARMLFNYRKMAQGYLDVYREVVALNAEQPSIHE